MNFTEQINLALKRQGLQKKWFAKELRITNTGLWHKQKYNIWSRAERFFIKHLLKLK